MGHYTKRLVDGVALHRDVDNIFCFNGKGFTNNGSADIQLNQRAKAIAIARLIPKARALRDMVVNYGFRTQSTKLLDRYSRVVYLEPGYVLKPFDGPAVPIIYDLSNITCPKFHPYDRVKYLNEKIPKSLARSTRVVTISQFVKKQIVEVYGTNEDIIDVVYPVVDSAFFPKTIEKVASALQNYHISPGYFLAVGTIEPRKNLLGLIEAFKRMPKELRVKHPLVIVGTKGWKCNIQSKSASVLAASGQMCNLGYVRQEDLPYIYAGACALVYPSFYEGFGMPVAEAMACGTPVITSNCSAMPEAAGNGALLVNPKDIEGITASMWMIVRNPLLREDLVNNSLEVSKKYTLENSVSSIIQTLKAAIELH
jgi:alpha-1,3-rhamnosyl/mannosyltransferase